MGHFSVVGTLLLAGTQPHRDLTVPVGVGVPDAQCLCITIDTIAVDHRHSVYVPENVLQELTRPEHVNANVSPMSFDNRIWCVIQNGLLWHGDACRLSIDAS